MTAVKGMDSNLTEVRYSIETAQGTLANPATWTLMEPNAEPRFGVALTTVERDVIDSDRMQDPGGIVDKNPEVSIEQDFTNDNQMPLLPAFFLALLGSKGQHAAITGIDDANDEFDAASGLDVFAAGDLVLGVGFGVAAIDTVHVVETASATALAVTTDLPALASIPTGAKLIKVGHQYASADVTVDASGDRPKLVTAAADFGDLDLDVGEAIYIGGDTAATQFGDAANNGEKRVFAIEGSGSDLVLDKSDLDMITDAAGTGKTIQIFVGVDLRNKSHGDGFVRTFVQLERALGAPDDAQPTQIQGEYVTGAMGSEYSLSIPAQDKITSTMTFMGQTKEAVLGSVGLKSASGTKIDNVPADAFNTSSDVIKFSVTSFTSSDEAPDQMFALVQSLDMTLNNNLGRRTALGVVGAARFGVGQLSVSGSLNAYFQNVTQLQSIEAYDKFTLHAFFANTAHQGFAIDMPCITLRTDGADVANNEDVMLACDYTAYNGRKYHPTFDHAICMTFFPYLPTLARTVR